MNRQKGKAVLAAAAAVAALGALIWYHDSLSDVSWAGEQIQAYFEQPSYTFEQKDTYSSDGQTAVGTEVTLTEVAKEQGRVKRRVWSTEPEAFYTEQNPLEETVEPAAESDYLPEQPVFLDAEGVKRQGKEQEGEELAVKVRMEVPAEKSPTGQAIPVTAWFLSDTMELYRVRYDVTELTEDSSYQKITREVTFYDGAQITASESRAVSQK